MNALFKHQAEAADFIISRGGSGAIFHEMGLGKTRTALEIFSRLRAGNEDLRPQMLLRMLVVCPLSLIEAAWVEDNARFAGFSCQNLNRDRKVIDPRCYILIVNYETLLADHKRILAYVYQSGERWLCVLDESSKIKNYQSQISKLMVKAADLFRYRIVMSGTPAPNSEMEYWPQMQFVAPGCLGTSMTTFRNRFFHLVNRYTGASYAGAITSRGQAAEVFRKCEYRITAAKRDELMRAILPYCHLARKRDCLDLPDMVDEIREIGMAPDQARVYREMEKKLVAEIRGQKIAAPMALTKLMKLRQITSGFIYNEFGEALETRIPTYGIFSDLAPRMAKDFENPKLKELFDIIEEAGSQPIMIWINFHWEQIKICHELHGKFGDGSVMTLSALTKDKDESIRAFQDGRARFLVAHPRSAAHGLTFVNCSLQIFFSLDFSWEAYEQARARIHRAGQVKKCTYVHIIAKDTVDGKILDVMRRKGNAQDLIHSITKGHG